MRTTTFKIRTFFVKNREVAFGIDTNARKTVKSVFSSQNILCAEEPGYLVETSIRKVDLGRLGIVVSSSQNTTLV